MRQGRAKSMVITGLVGLALIVGAASRARAGGDWNDGGVAWKPYQEGLAEAKKTKRPVCLIFYTDWCPHCKNYSGVFHDDKVVARAKDFVMIRVNADENKDLSKKYALDGGYIPRTYFLSPAGEVDPDLHAPRDSYKYFYDEHNPASVLAGMDAALKKYK